MDHLLHAALERRKTLLSSVSNTNAIRIIHSGGDGTPGITVDLLGTTLLVERHHSDAATTPLIRALSDRFGSHAPIYLKERWSRDARIRSGGQIAGEPGSSRFTVREDGLEFRIDLSRDEHIGLFLDSRPARSLVREISENRRVLNLFSYTGAFGVAAQAGGARSSTNIDNKRSALNGAQENYRLNNMPSDSRTFLKADVFKYLPRAAKAKGRYDLLILDPPPISKRPGGRIYRAETGYAKLVARCLPLVSSDGLVLTGLNAANIEDEQFLNMLDEAGTIARRKIDHVKTIGPGEDFPPCEDRPVARFSLIRVGGSSGEH